MAAEGGTQPWGVPSSAQVSPHHSLTHTVSQIPAPPLCRLAHSAPNWSRSSGLVPHPRGVRVPVALPPQHPLTCPFSASGSSCEVRLRLQRAGARVCCRAVWDTVCSPRWWGVALFLLYVSNQLSKGLSVRVGEAVHIYATPAPLLYHKVPDRSPRISLSALGARPALLPGPT